MGRKINPFNQINQKSFLQELGEKELGGNIWKSVIEQYRLEENNNKKYL